MVDHSGYKWWITQGTSGGSLRVQVVDHSGYKWWITQGTSGGSFRVQVVDHSISGYAWPTVVMQSMFHFITDFNLMLIVPWL